MTRKTNNQNMSLKIFTRSLRRGLGSAIVELKTNPQKEKYRDIVMRSCLKDIAYDTQVEGTKGYYLYTALKELDNPEDFLSSIVEKFGKQLHWRLSEQLFDILCCFSNDGYSEADVALENKYNDLKKRLPVISEYDLNFCEREQLESLMRRKLDGGFEAFKRCVEDMGEMIKIRGNDDCLWYDLFIEEAEDKWGNAIYAFIENAESENVKAFSQYLKKLETDESGALKLKTMTVNNFLKAFKYREDPRKEEVTIEKLLRRANELALADEPYPFRITSLSRRFAQTAQKKELKRLAEIILNEPSDFIKTALLCVFRYAKFPLDIETLFPYTRSDDENLCEASAKALSLFEDGRIHALALQLFDEGQIENALTLLAPNFVAEDEVLIRKSILRSKRLSFDMVNNITDIFEKHKSNTCGDILMHFYNNIECTHCRCNIVKEMINNEVMPEDVLDACMYDSYEETRKIAEKIKGVQPA